MVGYVRDNSTYLDYKSMNGHNILWFPLQIPLNISMCDFLDDVFSKYVNLLSEKVFENYIQREVIKQVEEVKDGILKVLRIHKSGDVITAYKEFEDLMEIHYKSIFPIKQLEKGYTFYRMRANEFNLKEPKEFYHLPSSLIHRCKSYRFSTSGYPCLYLGYSKDVCMVEMAPNGTMCGVELYKEDSELSILDLTFPLDNRESDNVMKFIKAWPLVASCYVVMANEQINRDAQFREEYIIPQMLTAYLKQNNICDGICYYSTRNENLNPYGRYEDDFRNIVLFTREFDESGYDKELIDMFHWYEPFNVGEIKQENK